MTVPTYTLDHVRAALGDDAAAKVRDYSPPPVVSAELRLARECYAKTRTDGGVSIEDAGAAILSGKWDDGPAVRAVLLALQRRHELDTPATPQPDADGWIAWTGGECPVAGSQVVAVRFRDGTLNTFGRQPADTFSWMHPNSGGKIQKDIIAYKPEPGK